MRKMKRFAAVLLSAALLCPMTAYADNSDDARALYHQVEEKQKALTDMNAFADFKISVGGDMLEEAGFHEYAYGDEYEDESYDRSTADEIHGVCPYYHGRPSGTCDHVRLLSGRMVLCGYHGPEDKDAHGRECDNRADQGIHPDF